MPAVPHCPSELEPHAQTGMHERERSVSTRSSVQAHTTPSRVQSHHAHRVQNSIKTAATVATLCDHRHMVCATRRHSGRLQAKSLPRQGSGPAYESIHLLMISSCRKNGGRVRKNEARETAMVGHGTRTRRSVALGGIWCPVLPRSTSVAPKRTQPARKGSASRDPTPGERYTTARRCRLRGGRQCDTRRTSRDWQRRA